IAGFHDSRDELRKEDRSRPFWPTELEGNADAVAQQDLHAIAPPPEEGDDHGVQPHGALDVIPAALARTRPVRKHETHAHAAQPQMSPFADALVAGDLEALHLQVRLLSSISRGTMPECDRASRFRS